MVVKPQFLPAVATALTLVMAAAVPSLGAYKAAQPDPLVKDALLRVLDMATAGKTARYGPVVAIGYRKDTKPGELFVTYSTDGGRSYLKAPDTLRQFRVAGDGMRGLSLDVCGGRIWAATAATYPGDASTDRDVLLTSRTIGGTAAQAFLTKSDAERTVSAVDVGCVGKKLLAVAWIEQSYGKSRAKLMLRSLETLGEAPCIPQGHRARRCRSQGRHLGRCQHGHRPRSLDGRRRSRPALPALRRHGRYAARCHARPSADDGLQRHRPAAGGGARVEHRRGLHRQRQGQGTDVRRRWHHVRTGGHRHRDGQRRQPFGGPHRGCERCSHRHRGNGQQEWAADARAHRVDRWRGHVGNACVRERRGPGRRPEQGHADDVGPRRGLAEQFVRRRTRSAPRSSASPPSGDRQPGAGAVSALAPRQGLGLVTAPRLAELTRAAYLAMTPPR